MAKEARNQGLKGMRITTWAKSKGWLWVSIDGGKEVPIRAKTYADELAKILKGATLLK